MTISEMDRIRETTAKLAADPTAGRTSPSVSAELVNGVGRLSSGAFSWEADLGPAVGGQNLAPTPTQYLLGALAGCAVVFLRDTLAPQFGVTVEAVRATARCSADTGGLLGVEGTSPALEGLALDVEVTSPDAPERLEEVFAAWRERCPIYLALVNPNDVSVSFAVERAGAADERR